MTNTRPRILVFGGAGQVGSALTAAAPAHGTKAVAPSSADCDITQRDAVAQAIAAAKPTIIVNAAAYTAVDAAEDDAATAYRINADGAEIIARAAQQAGVPLIHLSTDYVFDGTARTPYHETDIPRPTNVYGASKLAGEQHVMAAWPRSLVLRVSWVYSPVRSNFVKTMLRLARERDELRVVDDQSGTPCAARGIANAVLAIAENLAVADNDSLFGTYHYGTAPTTTWFAFAQTIIGQARDKGLIDRAPRIIPITTAEFPTRAQRPAWSVLDTTRLAQRFAIESPRWETELSQTLDDLANAPPPQILDNLSKPSPP